jgi:hypothetical protein
MKAVDFVNPQTLNLYTYCTNDPLNHTDPNGLGLISFFKKVFNWIKKHIVIVLIVVAIIVAVLLIPGAPAFIGSLFQNSGGFWSAAAAATEDGGGISPLVKLIFGISFAAAIAGIGSYIQNRQAKGSGSVDKDGRGKLTGERKKQYDKARDAAKKALENEECQKFLRQHGIDPKDVLEAINKQQAFDATTSTISVAEAGLFVFGEPESNQSVKDYFAENGAFAVTAITGLLAGLNTRYHVYYGKEPITSSRVLHEALHSFTTKDDLQLAIQLGLKGVKPSEEIAAALVDHKCGTN